MPSVRANAPLLKQALENLLANALKFTEPVSTPCIIVRAEERAGKVRIWVEDNGPGIAQKYHHLLFGAFQRLDQRDSTSTGIGLAIVRTATERMKGTVGLDSSLGKGSRFWIELPKG